MISVRNIGRISKMLILMLSVVFLFTACSSGTTDDAKNTPTQCLDDKDKVRPCTDEDYKNMEKQQVDCWQKAIIVNLYDIMGKTTSNMYTKITDGALALMMVAFAVWLSFRILSHVSSFVEENPAEVWTEVSRKFFLCLVCGIIASSPGFLLGILNMTVFPVYGAFLEFGSEILVRASDRTGVTFAELAGVYAKSSIADNLLDTSTGQNITTTLKEVELFNKPIPWFNSESTICRAGVMDNATLEDGFPEMPKEMMSCLICAVNQRMNLGFSLSFEVMRAPGLTATLVGLMILICFTIVKFGFVFYLVDTIFKFTVMITILPILVMGYAFQYTRGWLGNGVLQILNSAGFMMFIAVVIAMAMMAIEELITNPNNKHIFNPDNTDIKVAFQEFSIPFLCLLMICFLIASSIKVAQSLTDSLVGGSSKSDFVNKAKATLQFVVGIVLGFITGGMSKVVQASSTASKVAMKAAKAAKKINDMAGRD